MSAVLSHQQRDLFCSQHQIVLRLKTGPCAENMRLGIDFSSITHTSEELVIIQITFISS